ncbi:hypothetical protein [Litorivivens sp.]|uniref:hypothetical protein n=1 Tax=Litorivivens sp. TaxID=2020868 RepID=UPI003569F18F
MLKTKASSNRSAKPAVRKPDNTAFEMPPGYRDHTLRRLRESYTGDWWLNVDYVIRH